jgi:hypothetical protein
VANVAEKAEQEKNQEEMSHAVHLFKKDSFSLESKEHDLAK